MTMKKLLLAATLALAALHTMAIEIKRVEPISWWVGMKTPLQLMFYGADLKGSTVKVNSPDIKITKIHTADSPNYLFADVTVAPQTKAGQYVFTLTKDGKSVTVPYTFNKRAEGSAQRKSFNSSDVIYLLMPDRFAQGSMPDTVNSIPGKVDRADGNARHGGNLQGMIDHLDYIADLGATAIWSTPLTEDNEYNSSYHGYAASDYYLIDPRFGTNELYRQYVDQAHKKGLKVIQDLVPNHCGAGHWWMQDVPFADWINGGGKYTQTKYAQTAQFDTHASKADFDNNSDGWFVESMPDMNMRNPFVLNYLAQNAIWWAEYSGLDGFRVDTYPYNDKHAAARWTEIILDEYPNLGIVGECWVNEPAFVSYWEGAAKNKDGYSSRLTSVMDFPLQQRLNGALGKDSVNGWFEGAQALYFVLAQDFLYADPSSLLIFAENHDTDRLAHFTKGNAKKQMLAYTLLATMRGIPQLYYGSEQLFRGNQSQGHGGQRIDFPGGWAQDTVNLFTGQGRTKAQDSVLKHVQKLFQWRKTSPAVQGDELVHFFPDVPENLYVYGRTTPDELVFVVLNMNKASREVKWDKYKELFQGRPAQGVDIVSGRKVTVGEPLTLKGFETLVLQIKK